LTLRRGYRPRARVRRCYPTRHHRCAGRPGGRSRVGGKQVMRDAGSRFRNLHFCLGRTWYARRSLHALITDVEVVVKCSKRTHGRADGNEPKLAVCGPQSSAEACAARAENAKQRPAITQAVAPEM